MSYLSRAYIRTNLCCDTPHGLKTSGFWIVTNPNVFSSWRTSYAGMRAIPYTRGGCHCRNNVRDTEFPTILVSGVLRSYPVAVLLVATSATREGPTRRSAVLAMPA